MFLRPSWLASAYQTNVGLGQRTPIVGGVGNVKSAILASKSQRKNLSSHRHWQICDQASSLSIGWVRPLYSMQRPSKGRDENILGTRLHYQG